MSNEDKVYKRKLKDRHKSIRIFEPIIDREVERLVNVWNRSPGKKRHQKRYAHARGPKKPS